MNSQQFVIWLKGFAAAAGEFTLTPKQWDDLKEQLNNVDDTPYVSDNFTIGHDGAYERDPHEFQFGVPNAESLDTTVTYTTNDRPNWYTTTVAKEKTLLND